VFGKPVSDPRWRQAVVKYRGLWDSPRNMVQVSHNSSCEPLVVIVKIEARLEVGQRQTEPLCSVKYTF
jgi:hypothetical protein